MEKKRNNFFPRVSFPWKWWPSLNLGHSPVLQGTHNFKTTSSNAVKSCTHIEDIQMKKRTEAFQLLLHNTFVILFCVKKTPNSTKFQILLNTKNQNV